MSDTDSDCMVLDEEESDFGYGSSDYDEENVAPVVVKRKAAAPKPKRAAAPKKKATAVDDDNDSVSTNVLSPTKSNAEAGKKEKTIEEIYQKKSQIEHILIRPDTYVGSTQPLTVPMYILNDKDRIVEKEITYTPGLFKIFDEIVVNAADNKQRDPNMDKIEINVDAESNTISVKNNGKGIPIVKHKEQGVYVPTMIFGQLLTGSNFDDDEQKTTGGRNGYGAKLANVFSTQFIVECVDAERGLRFHQIFRSNMSVAENPTIKNCSTAERKAGDFVKISFSPDLERFKMNHLDENTVGLFSKRAYDIAGTMASSGGKRLQVTLNGKKLTIKSFKDYINTFDNVPAPVAFASTDRWEVGVAPSNDAAMQQISFVNSINTSSGGKHVIYIADQIANHLIKVLKKKNKGGTDLKKAQIVNHLFIMVNCLIENPSFDSQTKDKLNTQAKNFGSEFKLSPEFLKKVEKSEIAEKILSYASFKDREALKRKGGVKKVKLTGIAKLDDANHAGGPKSKDCTLIITEGDSAKSLAMAGLSVVGRDHYGVFPLKGKPMNVRDALPTAVGKNEEIKNLVDIMGLKFGTVYDSTNIKTLRYGHLMIMADQDSDGSHIKGLIINFIHNFWPSLLDVPGFLQQFITPIVKVTKGKRTRQFFTLPEYEQWLESTGNNGKGFTIKYYKGLGTSTSAEAKEYFSNLDLHEVHFDLLSRDVIRKDEHLDEEVAQVLPDNVESGSDLIDMVFRKERVDDRKLWLSHVRKDIYLDFSTVAAAGLRYSDFINKEYILFSNYDNDRSIPHVMDGFKPSQRKVLYGCFKRKLYKNEIKVAQLVGYVAEHSSYHHGEQSLQGTIVGMAQNFVGSNNINLLTPSGQFGTRRMGGKDAASPRYIFTKLEAIARAIFHPDDDELLNYLNDDGATIEPEYYIPVIPMVLCNGAEGIGTGWSSNVVNYSPREIIANLRRKIAGEEMMTMAPYFCGFTGLIQEDKAGKYTVFGRIERVDDTTMLISELPIKKWTQTYKEFLEAMLVGDSKAPPEIKDLRENHTETTVSFTVIASKENIDDWEKNSKGGLYGKFKLSASLSTSNMTLFDEEGRITKYDTPEDIVTAFYHVRLEYYDKRKANLIRNLEAEKRILSNKARFVEEVCSGDLVVSNRKRKDILEELQQRGYDLIAKDAKKTDKTSDDEGDEAVEEEEETSTSDLAKGYEYLLGMKIWSLTYEKAEQLRSQLAEKVKELTELQATDPSQIWLRDLDAIEVALDERDQALQAAEVDERRAQKKNQTRNAKKKVENKKKKKDEWDSDMESESESEKMDMESDSEDQLIVPQNHVVLSKGRPVPAAKVTATTKAPVIKRVVATAALASSSLNTKSQDAKRPPSPDLVDSDGDFGLGESLIDRMRNKLVVSPAPKKNPSMENIATKKRPSPRMNAPAEDYDDIYIAEEEVEPKPVKAKKPAAKIKVATKKSSAKDSKEGTTKTMSKPAARKKATSKDEDSDSADDIKMSMKVVKKKPSKPPARRKSASYDEDSDSADDFEFRSDDEAPAAALPARARPARATVAKKQTTYTFSSDENDSNDDFE